MELASINVIAWQWLKQAIVAKQKMLITPANSDDMAFYESKVALAEIKMYKFR